jgi:predicted nucleotidyltransferase
MNVVGFKEAYEFSTTMKLSDDPPLEIKVPTLAGRAVLKIFSWKDKYPGRKKDAEDLLFIMNHYEHADTMDRLYEDEVTLLEKENFDCRLAGIRLPGKDMARIGDGQTRENIQRVLQKETADTLYSKLVMHMTGPDDDYATIFSLLVKLKEGFGCEFQAAKE